MRMKPEHFDFLAVKVCQELSLRTRLIVMRRILRHVMACDLDERTTVKQMIRKFKTRLPFSAAQVAKLETLLKDCRHCNRELILEYGLIIRSLSKQIQLAMSFAQLCDVLCVNPVHRAEAFAADDGSLYGVLWIGGQFEDSAHHHGKSGRYTSGPITRAVDTVTQDFIIHNSHLLPDPTAPGGPLYGVPTYYQQPDGTMARKSASLTVHDADGSSRVVERKIEVKL